MEHIIQFAIGIDDDAIRKRIEESGYDQIIKNLMNEAKKDLPKKGYYRDGNVDWEEIVSEAMTDFLAENKDEIIAAAATKLTESYKRTKAWKEKVGEVVTIRR